MCVWPCSLHRVRDRRNLAARFCGVAVRGRYFHGLVERSADQQRAKPPHPHQRIWPRHIAAVPVSPSSVTPPLRPALFPGARPSAVWVHQRASRPGDMLWTLSFRTRSHKLLLPVRRTQGSLPVRVSSVEQPQPAPAVAPACPVSPRQHLCHPCRWPPLPSVPQAAASPVHARATSPQTAMPPFTPIPVPTRRWLRVRSPAARCHPRTRILPSHAPPNLPQPAQLRPGPGTAFGPYPCLGLNSHAKRAVLGGVDLGTRTESPLPQPLCERSLTPHTHLAPRPQERSTSAPTNPHSDSAGRVSSPQSWASAGLNPVDRAGSLAGQVL